MVADPVLSAIPDLPAHGPGAPAPSWAHGAPGGPSSSADAWWNALSPTRRASVHRWLTARDARPAVDGQEPLPL